MSETNVSLLRFLTELRRRLIYCAITFVCIFAVLFYFANDLYTLLALPLLKHLPVDNGLIATNIVAPFFVPFQLTTVVALFLTIPIFLYQLWAFIAPALYQHERALVWPLLLLSILLFYIGVCFAYFIIFPIMFGFLTQTAPQGVQVRPDISQYLDFTLKLLFTFGAIFEVPIAIILLVWTKAVTQDQLKAFRPYAIVGAFVIAMLVGPPDVISQTLVAIPLCLLFELGLLFSRQFSKKK